MEDPPNEIPSIIHTLTNPISPSHQLTCIQTYFHPTASLTHPLCRTGSFGPEYLPRLGSSSGLNSRWFIIQIYRWYSILFPASPSPSASHVTLTVDSIAYDAAQLRVYACVHQILRFRWLPWHASDVRLVVVLRLVEDEARNAEIRDFDARLERKVLRNDYAAVGRPRKRYLIASQEDLYQVGELAGFMVLVGGVVKGLVMLVQFFGMAVCVVGALVLWPVTYLEEVAFERRQEGERRRMLTDQVEEEQRPDATGVIEKVKGWVVSSSGNGGAGDEKED